VRRRKEKQYWGRKEKVKEKGKRKKEKSLDLYTDQRDKPYTFLSLFLTTD